MLLGGTLLSTSGDGTAITSFRWAAEDPLSVRVITGLFQSPLKPREVFPLISAGRILYWVGHQGPVLSQGKLPGGELRNTIGVML